MKDYAGLNKLQDVINITEIYKGITVDFTAFDIRKYFHSLLKGTPNTYLWAISPYVIIDELGHIPIHSIVPLANLFKGFVGYMKADIRGFEKTGKIKYLQQLRVKFTFASVIHDKHQYPIYNDLKNPPYKLYPDLEAFKSINEDIDSYKITKSATSLLQEMDGRNLDRLLSITESLEKRTEIASEILLKYNETLLSYLE